LLEIKTLSFAPPETRGVFWGTKVLDLQHFGMFGSWEQAGAPALERKGGFHLP